MQSASGMTPMRAKAAQDALARRGSQTGPSLTPQSDRNAPLQRGQRHRYIRCMRLRVGRIALLVFQAVWLNAFLPGHERGVVTLGGDPSASCHAPRKAAASHGCCPTSKDDDSSNPSERGRAGRCAVCHFAARLTPPPPVDLVPAPTGVAERRPAERVEHLVSLVFPPVPPIRGPPAAA